MAYRQDGPVPEQVRFTLRVDSETNPALAELLWQMPWGERNGAVVELLELGLRAKQEGLSLPAAPVKKRAAPTTLPPAAPALVPSARASIEFAAPAAEQAVRPAPLSLDPARAVASATDQPAQDEDAPSAVSLLLGQFGA